MANRNKKSILKISLIVIIVLIGGYIFSFIKSGENIDPLALVSKVRTTKINNVQNTKENTVQNTQNTKPVSSNSVYTGVSTNKICDCSYKLLTVSGVGSTADHPLHQWVADIFGDPLQRVGDSKAVSAQINAAINAELSQKDPKKILIIAHSIGAINTFNLLNKESYNGCVEAIYIDPPTSQKWCKLPGAQIFSPIFNDRAGQICKALGGGIVNDPDTIYTTGGTTKPVNIHDPFTPANQDSFGNPVRTEGQIEALNKIRGKIDEKIKSCVPSAPF